MIGKIFVTSSGYDPVLGKHIKDPFLGPNPSLGACRPDIRKQLQQGDYIFVVSGKIRNAPQVVLGGFQIAEKISALDAYYRFPEHRLRTLPDGQLTGNVIVSRDGRQHPLDNHDKFSSRVNNYIVGTNGIALTTREEIDEGRRRTLDILSEVYELEGDSVRDIIGRCRNMDAKQVAKLCNLLCAVKNAARPLLPRVSPIMQRVRQSAANGLEN